MSQTNVNENGAQLAARIREMREILEFSQEELAAKIGIAPELYRSYEDNAADVPISTIYALASVFEVDFTTLLTGEAPRMGGYTVVRSGQGLAVNRNPEYRFQSLAFNFKGRTMEPMIVDLIPGDTPAKTVTHGGQEFNMVLSGRMKMIIGQHEFILETGDSIYFDPNIPHAQHPDGVPARFLTVIQ